MIYRWCVYNILVCFFRKIPEVANGEDKSGTTAICALISTKYVIFSNCGDSRGVLSGDGARPVLVTQDHKPSNPPELERIQNAGTVESRNSKLLNSKNSH